MARDDDDPREFVPRPKITDVARLSGVGVGTVSRVLNGKPNVSAAAIAAVQGAVEALGYRRNDSARVLRTGATKSVALLVEDVADPFFSLLNRAVEEEVIRCGSVLWTASSSKDAHRARELVLSFSSRRVDGMILTLPEDGEEDYLVQERAAGMPMVFVDRPAHTVDADTVLADNRGGAEAGVAHLLSHGHTRIACITDRADLFTARERLAGYATALARAGIPRDPELVFSAAPDGPGIQATIDRLLENPDPPTAVFAGNNRTSVHVIRALHRRGVTLAFVGFDDFELAELVVPSITVVAQDPPRMGRVAMELLRSRMEGDDRPTEQIVLETRVIPRGSGEIPGPGGPLGIAENNR